MRLECADPSDCCYVHLTLMPYISSAGELKTKPTQSSVKSLRSVGIQPDVIVCRTEVPMSGEGKDKIALFCNVKTSNVIQNMDVDMLYDLPLVLEKEGLARAVLAELHLPDTTPDLEGWRMLARRAREVAKPVRVAVVSKYPSVPDACLSVMEAIRHAAIQTGVRAVIDLVDARSITEDTAEALLGRYAALVIPGGYGATGADGMIAAARFARENQIPFLAIGYGMQLTIVEAARSLLQLADAHTTEVDCETRHAVVRIPEERICQNDSRSRARMGLSGIKLADGMLRTLYGSDCIAERHSNRYEVDPAYVQALAQKGLKLAGSSVDAGYPEAFELEGHPFYAAVIYHPEYISRPGKPHPLFSALIKAAVAR